MPVSATRLADPAPHSWVLPELLRRREFWISLLAHAGLLLALDWPTLRPAGPPAPPLQVYVVDAVASADAVPSEAAPLPPAAPLRRSVAAPAAALGPVADLPPVRLPLPVPRWQTVEPVRLASPPTVTDPGPAAGLALHLSEHLRRHQFYPRAARRAGIEGQLRLQLRLDGEGRVLQASLASGSGHAILDDAALALIARAQPFPSPRKLAGLDQLEIELPLEYRLATASLAAGLP